MSATVQQPVPADYRVFAYSLSGKGFYGEGRAEIDAQKMVVFQNDGESVTITASPSRSITGGGGGKYCCSVACRFNEAKKRWCATDRS